MARSFNGSSDFIQAASPISFSGAGPFAITLSGWFNQPSGTSATDIIGFGTGPNDTTHCQFRLSTVSNVVQGDLRFNTGDSTSLSSTTFSFNTWNHAAAVFLVDATPNLTNVIAYLNGGGKNNTSFTVSTAARAATGTAIGALVLTSLGQFNFFSGSLAETAWWNIQLTDGEILALAKGALPGQIRPASLQSWLALDGSQSPEPDFSSFANNGTLTGTTRAVSGPPVMMFTPRWPQFLAPPPPPVFTLMPQIVT